MPSSPIFTIKLIKTDKCFSLLQLFEIRCTEKSRKLATDTTTNNDQDRLIRPKLDRLYRLIPLLRFARRSFKIRFTARKKLFTVQKPGKQ